MKREGEIKSEHLEILLRLVKERVIRQSELSKIDIAGLEYWINSGMVFKNEEGRNPEEPLEKEIHYLITDKGEEYYLNYNHGYNNNF
jgi:hypothetical protein